MDLKDLQILLHKFTHFKGLHLFFLSNFPEATFIQGAMSIPDSRVMTLHGRHFICTYRLIIKLLIIILWISIYHNPSHHNAMNCLLKISWGILNLDSDFIFELHLNGCEHARILKRTTDTQWRNCLHCTAENQIPIPNF